MEPGQLKGKGLGAVATRDIHLGERVLAEAPLTIQGPGLPPLESTVGALPPDKRRLFFSLAQARELYGETKTK